MVKLDSRRTNFVGVVGDWWGPGVQEEGAGGGAGGGGGGVRGGHRRGEHLRWQTPACANGPGYSMGISTTME